jgi:spermidine/putrescine transport system substrate-binding protein
MRTTAIAVLTLAAALGLAACGGGESGGDGTTAQVAQAGKPTGSVTISNWPGYIDPGNNNTVAKYEEATGVDTTYVEDINDNNAFFGKVQPDLASGSSGGRSIFIVTDWMAKQMYDLGYLQQIDYSDVPNVQKNITAQAQQSVSDPGRKYTIPWQSGLTGIWVDTSKAPEIKSINDLFDPKYKGKVTFLTEMRDTVPLVMQGEGIDPKTATKQQWLDAIDKLQQASDSGQIRRFTGNEYTEDLTAGNVVASVGWSGDASLIGNKNAEWRKPTEGCTIFTDSMVIPIGAPNPQAALAWADFVYQPDIAAPLAAYITYVSPVKGVREELEKTDPETASNPLIFPPPKFIEGCIPNPNPPGSPEDQAEVTEAFQDVVTG